jgi:hypothetical protein
MLEGDSSYILRGYSVPVILRKTEIPDKFEFVRECYLHGFMDREALVMRVQGVLIAQELKLV